MKLWTCYSVHEFVYGMVSRIRLDDCTGIDAAVRDGKDISRTASFVPASQAALIRGAADGVLPASCASESARCRGNRGVDGRRRALSAMGILDAV